MDKSNGESAGARMTLVMAVGALLRQRDDGGPSVVLEVVQPRKRARPWRAVPRAHVAKHMKEWADARGITL